MWKVFHYGELTAEIGSVVTTRCGTVVCSGGEGGVDDVDAYMETSPLNPADDEAVITDLAESLAKETVEACKNLSFKQLTDLLLDSGLWWNEVRTLLQKLGCVWNCNYYDQSINPDKVPSFTKELTRLYKEALRRDRCAY